LSRCGNATIVAYPFDFDLKTKIGFVDAMNNSSDPLIEIFNETLKRVPAERTDYLDQTCGSDGELRQRLESLLAAHDKAGEFLDEPVTLLRGRAAPKRPAGGGPGDQIGPYKLLQEIGEGGCGIVFMAEQAEPIRRRVALKLVKPGMDTKTVIARFEAERQALALMDHPNIAKVFDAGATASGHPYFVMELIRGIKITDYCDQNSLPTEERLKLFIQVCQAVQHAHQKGIIHRDIKPSNILVTESLEGKPVPVVIDFGVAKAVTNQRLTDKTLFTAFEMLIGTPAYMSPEQAALTSVDVDTRADVYSLGVLLYELLTGSTPFDTTRLLKAGIDEVRRAIREQEPAWPSTRLSHLSEADLTRVAQSRKSEPPRLIKTVHGDLDCIVMQALEKDRTHRYQTAQDLALDIQRFLANEAISARPPSKLYKFNRLVLRNRLLFAGIGAIALLLIVSLVVTWTALTRERRAHRDANAEAAKSQQMASFLKEILKGVGPSAALGQDTTMLQGILDKTVERLGAEMTNQPAVEAEMRKIIGTLYFQTGKYHQAQEMQTAALAIRRKVFGSDSAEAAASLNDLGLALQAEGKLLDAEKADSEALAIRRRLFGDKHADTATSLNDLGSIYRQQGNLVRAETLVRDALEVRRALFGKEHLDVADSLRNLCIILGDQGKWAESEAMAREVLAMRRKLLAVPDHPWIASALDDVAWAASGMNKLDEAERFQREALAMHQKVLPAGHPFVAQSLHLIGDTMRKRGNLEESYSVLSAALSLQRKLMTADDPALLDTMKSLGLTLQAEGKWSEAESIHREALSLWRKRAGNHHPQTLFTLRDLASTLEGEGKWSEAETLHREALAEWRKASGDDDPQTIYTLHRVALALRAQRKWSEAESLHREAVTLWRKRAGNDNPETLYALRNLAETLEYSEKWSEAAAKHREALVSWRKQEGTEGPQSIYTLQRLGATLEAAGEWPEAEQVNREAFTISRKDGEYKNLESLKALERLVRALAAQKKFDEAEQLLGTVLTPAFVRQSNSIDLLVLRVDILGRQKKWHEAATNAALVVELQPSDHYRYHQLAGLLAIINDRPAYEQLCQGILTAFGDTKNPYIAERAASDCLLLPASSADPQLVSQLADRAVTFGQAESAKGYFQACKALSEYRLGNYSKAIEWSGRLNDESDPFTRAKAFAISAMAHWKRGENVAATALLAGGKSLVADDSGSLSSDLGPKWLAWIFARIALEEAVSLIESPQTQIKAKTIP
jgi:eukaryotic-like serine/threonine-protein kinase